MQNSSTTHAVRAQSVRVLGSRVDILSVEDAVLRMEDWIREPWSRCRRVVVTGFHGLWEAHRDPELRRILNSADLWIPDGIAPVIVAKWRGLDNACRVPGAELMQAYLAKADFMGYRSFFYGDTPDTLAALKGAVEERYPGHEVAGIFSPPFGAISPEEDEKHVSMINEARPDVLWVGLGMPKQDRWIYAHADRLRVPVAVGVGAAFGFLSGRVRRAPGWLGKAGFEWAYRLIKEPQKCWRRSLVQGPQFLALVLLEIAGLKRYE